MAFQIPTYYAPDFTQEKFRNAPDVRWAYAPRDGVAPEYFHSTSMYPEYFKIDGNWVLAEESRMDSSVVIGSDGKLQVVENRNLKQGDRGSLSATTIVTNVQDFITIIAKGLNVIG